MTPAPSTPPRSPPVYRWIALLAALALISIVVLIILYPVARALGDALSAAITAHGGLVAGALLTFGAALLLGIVRIVFAYGRRLSAQARQAEILRLPNDHPIHVADVTLLAARLAPQTLDRYYAVEAIRADRSQFPNLTTYHHAPHLEASAAPALPQPTELPVPPALPLLAPGLPLLAQLQARGHICRSGRSLLVGYSDGQQPLYIELTACGFIGIGGQSRSGKSTTTMLLIAQALLLRWHLFVGDPHIHKADSLLNRCRPLSGQLARQAVTPEEIAALVRLVDKIGRRRVQGDADRTPVLLILDEFTNLIWRKELPADVLRILPSMAIEYAGVGVHGIVISHDWSKASLGGELGAALRRAITHRLVHRSDLGNAEFLLPSGALARQVPTLPTGQTLYWGPEGGQVATVPGMRDEDMQLVAQGQPERPYQPWPPQRLQPAASGPASAPAAPPAPAVARSIPPTEPLPQPTVQEQIVDLLWARPWQTSSVIAATLGVDLKVVQTELKALFDQRRLTRREARAGRDRYEWSTTQPLNPPTLTPTA